MMEDGFRDFLEIKWERMLENEVYGGTGELMEDYEIDCND